jgi:hypothetical protein
MVKNRNNNCILSFLFPAIVRFLQSKCIFDVLLSTNAAFMKVIPYLLILLYNLLFLLPAYAQKIIKFQDNTSQLSLEENESNSLIVKYSPSKFILLEEHINNKVFHKVKGSENGSHTSRGLPELPLQTVLIAIPNKSSVHLNLLEYQKEVIKNAVIFPHQGTVYRNPKASSNRDSFHYNSTFYSGNDCFPKNMISNENIVSIGHQKYFQFQINPFIYCPADSSLTIISDLELAFEISHMDTNSVLSDLKRKTPLSLSDGHSKPDSLFPSLYIIAADTMYNSIIPFAEWKNRKGIKTSIVRLSEISSIPDPVRIKKHLKDSFDAGVLEYVLLVGDVNYIPSFYGIENALNDHEYAKLNGNDYLPDIITGRFPVNSPEECNIIVEKTINYERYPDISPGNEWYNKASVIASNANMDNMHGVHLLNYLNKKGFSEVDDLRAKINKFNAFEISDALNDGRSLVFYIGHGSSTEWKVLPSGFNNNHIRDLNNTEKMPAIISVACSNADLDYLNGPCFAETWMHVDKNKGAITFLGATEDTPFFYSDTLGKGSLISYIDREAETFGEAMTAGKLKMYMSFPETGNNTTTEKTMQQFILLGDPSLMPWTDVPIEIKADYPPLIQPGLIEFSFHIDTDQEFDKALICISNADFSLYERAYSNEQAQVHFSFHYDKTDTLFIVISGYNLNTHEGMIIVDSNISPPEVYKNRLLVYPNPTKSFVSFTISHEYLKISSLSIYDYLGRMIETKENINKRTYHYYNSDLSSGLYLVKLKDSSGKTHSSRFMRL